MTQYFYHTLIFFKVQLTEQFISHKIIFEGNQLWKFLRIKNKIALPTFIYLGFKCIFKQEWLLLKNHEKEEFKKLFEFYSSIINLNIAELNMWGHKIIMNNITSFKIKQFSNLLIGRCSVISKSRNLMR